MCPKFAEYQLVGDSGPVLLFLHGTPGGYDQGTSVPEVRVLTPSRPGYLRTPIDVECLGQANPTNRLTVVRASVDQKRKGMIRNARVGVNATETESTPPDGITSVSDNTV